MPANPIFGRMFIASKKNATEMWLKEKLRLKISPEKSRITNLKRKCSKFLGIELRAVKSRHHKIEHRVCVSKVGTEEKEKIYQKYKTGAKTLLKNKITLPKWDKFISLINGIKNYYSMATRVYRDMEEVDQKLWRFRKKNFEQRKDIKKLLKTHSPKGIKGSESPSKALSLAFKTKFSLYPRKSKKNFSESLKSLEKFVPNLNEIRKRYYSTRIYGTVEKADITLSKFTMQKGKDIITGCDLNDPHLHRIKPGFKKGEYTFKNCILVNKLTHKVIHSTKETIERFINIFNLKKKKTNKLRKLWEASH